jgi:arylsulfatase A-like enzyme
MDAHAPYFPSGPPGFAFGTTPATPADFELLQNWEQIDKLALDRRAQQLASDSYDSCLRALDEHIKSLLVQLDRHALLGQTLIIVTADHGEAFGEHDLFVHGDSVYRAETQVPLLIVPPARHATQAAVDEVVSLRDLPATIVDLLELKAPSPFQGASLARFWKSQTTNRLECAVSELAEPNPINPNFGRSPAKAGPLSAVTDGHYTLIVGPKSEELYDETTDPAQSQNLAADPAMSAIVDRLRFELRRALGQNPAQTSSISAPENDPGRAAGGRLRPTD